MSPGCGNGGIVYSNPGYPEDPSAHPTTAPSAPATETAAPTTNASSAPVASTTPSATPHDEEPFAEIPKDGGGKVVKQPDGTCKYVFPERDFSCPPTMHCNPGPPQKPLKVKCPADGKTQP